jgi:hypothetical protein
VDQIRQIFSPDVEAPQLLRDMPASCDRRLDPGNRLFVSRWALQKASATRKPRIDWILRRRANQHSPVGGSSQLVAFTATSLAHDAEQEPSTASVLNKSLVTTFWPARTMTDRMRLSARPDALPGREAAAPAAARLQGWLDACDMYAAHCFLISSTLARSGALAF